MHNQSDFQVAAGEVNCSAQLHMHKLQIPSTKTMQAGRLDKTSKEAKNFEANVEEILLSLLIESITL